MREIILDTETTGLDPSQGHRIIEIGCVELVNLVPTGNVFHKYLNPERDIPAEATKVHGLTEEFLKDHPVFREIFQEFLDFIGEAPLVAHNAEFDMRFINWELKNVGHQEIPMSRTVDTLQLARGRFPGSPNNLDALCKRLGVDNSNRTKHGALVDSEILAAVYLELKGGKQAGLELVQQKTSAMVTSQKKARAPRSFPLSREELEAHGKFISTLKEPLWLK
ncbi:MAG: DNA polymerase III subunit epsilon [Proteobacteria bacterium]|nr:DNA polymerase III subunit epsilon [Pseudomonadota bacterium]